jgi:disulfide bond formation protein DsbB
MQVILRSLLPYKSFLLIAAWSQALIGTMGSLYFSEIAHFPPCILCWYQRICLYPLVVILAVGILTHDRAAWRYALPLAVAGWIIAFYHNGLYYKIIPENAAPCALGVSCTTQFIAYFGFLTIPLLSLLAFTSIIVLLLTYRRLNAHE